MDKERAMKVWEELFPGQEEAYDYASHKMRRDDFGNEESDMAWDIDLIKPLSAGGSFALNNLLPASLSTIALRGGKSSFRIGQLLYEVRRGKRYGQFAIYDITDRNAPIDLTPDEGTQDEAFNEARMRRSLGSDGFVSQGKNVDLSAPLRNSLFGADVEKENEEEQNPEVSEEDISAEEPLDEEKEEFHEEETDVEEDETKEEEETKTEIPEIEESTFSEQKEEVLEPEVTTQQTKEEDPLLVEVEKLRAEKTALEEKVASLEDALVVEKEKTEEAEERQKSLRAESEGEKERLRKEILDRESKISALEQEKASCREEIERKMASILTEEEKEKELVEQIQTLQEKVTRLEEEKEKLEKEKEEREFERTAILHEKEEKEREIASLSAERERLISETDKARTETDSLRKELEEERARLNGEKEEEKAEVERLQGIEKTLSEKERQIVELNEAISNFEKERKAVEEEKEGLASEVERLRGEIASINERGIQNEALMVDKEKELDQSLEEKRGLEENIAILEEEIRKEKERGEAIEKDKKEIEERLVFAVSLGKTDKFEEVKNGIEEAGLPFDEENVKKYLQDHPDCASSLDESIHKAPNATVVEEKEVDRNIVVDMPFNEDERARRAYGYYEELIGEGKLDASDFASREIKERHYRREDTPFGWDYALFDKNGPDDVSNVFVANLKTISEYTPDGIFRANGHEFRVEEKNGRKAIVSTDTIADPYDFVDALKVSEENMKKKTNLIYLYIKACGVSSTFPERKEVNAFFDIVDRTAKRCSPSSFIEIKANTGSNSDSLFLTFDATKENAYKEAFDYAVLLNSYRLQFQKRGGLNAIIVLDQIEVPSSMRHLSFDKLYSETKDVDLNAIRYDLNLTSVINTTIKRTVHIGPEIIDYVPIAKDKLTPSRLGMGTFSDLFGFGKCYMECNFVFDVSRKADEAKDD